MTDNTQSNRASMCVCVCVFVYNVAAFFYSDVLSGVFTSEAWGM